MADRVLSFHSVAAVYYDLENNELEFALMSMTGRNQLTDALRAHGFNYALSSGRFFAKFARFDELIEVLEAMAVANQIVRRT